MQNRPEALLEMSFVHSHKATNTIATYTSLNPEWTAEFCNVMTCITKMYGLHTLIKIYCTWMLQICAIHICDRDGAGRENDILLFLLLWWD